MFPIEDFLASGPWVVTAIYGDAGGTKFFIVDILWRPECGPLSRGDDFLQLCSLPIPVGGGRDRHVVQPCAQSRRTLQKMYFLTNDPYLVAMTSVVGNVPITTGTLGDAAARVSYIGFPYE